MQAQLTPQLAGQPTTAEQTRAPQFQAAQFYLQTVDGIGGDLEVGGEQTQVRIFLLLFIKHRQRLAPGRLLLIVDFAEIENGSLYRLAGTDAMVFYDAAVAIIFAVFFTIIAAQKHANDRLSEVRCRREGTWSPLDRFPGERR